MDFTEAVKAAMDVKKMSTADLARMTGRSYQYVRDLLRGDRRWHEAIINEVCTALDLKIEVSQAAKEATGE